MAHDARIAGAIWGAVVGDAMGLPVAFESRALRKQDPVQEMRGFQGFYQETHGTWSEPSSFFLTSLESFIESGKVDRDALAVRYAKILSAGAWTAHGVAIGFLPTTQNALQNLADGLPLEDCADASEWSNNSACLSRCVAVALSFCWASPQELMAATRQVIQLTHAHPLSVTCGIWLSLFVAEIVKDKSLARPDETLEEAAYWAWKHLNQSEQVSELAELDSLHVLSQLSEIRQVSESDLRSTPSVVETLKASVWCVAQSRFFEECLPRAVNLGGATPTIAALSGALAGALWGIDPIPGRWSRAIARREEVADLVYRATQTLPWPKG